MKCVLNDIIKDIQTGPFGSQLHRSDYSSEGTPVIMPQDIVDWNISTEKIVRVGNSHVDRLARHKVEYLDIIYPRRGDVSKCALITEEIGWLCGTGCLKVKIDSEKANPQYVFYYLQQPHVGKWIELHSTGATMMNINSSTLRELPLDIPEHEIQNKICEIISNYDSLIANCHKQIALLEEAAQRLYREWFVNFRFPGHESTPIIDGLPQGWRKDKLKDVVEYEIGGGWGEDYPKVGRDNEAFVIRCTDFNDLNNGNFKSLPDRFHSEGELSSRVLEIGDVIFEVSGGSKTEGVGKTYYITAELLDKLSHPVMCASFCKLIRFIDRSNSVYYYDTLRFWKENGDTSIYDKRSASNIVNFNWKAFLNRKDILSPPEHILSLYSSYRTPMVMTIRNLQLSLSSLKEARDMLLSRLMSGEIDVSKISEPVTTCDQSVESNSYVPK